MMEILCDEVDDDITEPLRNGAELPTHPNDTTSKKIVEYVHVYDDANGKRLTGGLHNNEVSMLMNGEIGSLGHLYKYKILNKRIYHTRPLVCITCKVVDVD